MSNNNVISSSDPDAISKLTAKKEKAQKIQTIMKGVNAHWRKTGTCMGAPGITDEQAKKIDERVSAAKTPWDNVPFSDYELKNNNAEIKRLDNRIDELTFNKEVGFAGWKFDGGHADASTMYNRLRLFFDKKPSDSQRAQLKSNGFKWAPSQGAWQRQLNDNAIFAAGRIDFIKPSDGRSVSEHQPKAPVRSAVAR